MPEQLRLDLDLELEALALYRRGIVLAERLEDPGTRELLVGLLRGRGAARRLARDPAEPHRDARRGQLPQPAAPLVAVAGVSAQLRTTLPWSLHRFSDGRLTKRAGFRPPVASGAMTNPLVMELDAAQSFLAAPRIGMLAVARRSGPPIASPIWYGYEPGGDVVFNIGRNSAKARALRAAGVASLCAEQEQLPYAFVTVDGPVVVDDTGADEGCARTSPSGTSARSSAPATSSRRRAATTCRRA